MQVTITHASKTEGMLRKATYFEVSVAVRFSPAEYAVIERHDLGAVKVLDRHPPARVRKQAHDDGLWNLKISNLGSDTYACETPLEAKNYDAELRDALPKLKAYLDANMTPMSGTDTFEL